MAITYLGTDTVQQSSSQSDSFAITVPSDCEMIVLHVACYIASGSSALSEHNFDNGATADFTEIISQPYTYSGDTDDQASAAYYMLDTDVNWPGTGSKTLYYSFPTTLDEGAVLTVTYWKGIDKTTTIGDTDSQEGSDAGYGATGWTGSLAGVGASDMMVVASYHYGTGLDVDPSGSGQTLVLESSAFNNDMLGISYEVGGSTPQVDGSWRVPIAFVINAAAVGGPTTKPPKLHGIHNQFASITAARLGGVLEA